MVKVKQIWLWPNLEMLILWDRGNTWISLIHVLHRPNWQAIKARYVSKYISSVYRTTPFHYLVSSHHQFITTSRHQPWAVQPAMNHAQDGAGYSEVTRTVCFLTLFVKNYKFRSFWKRFVFLDPRGRHHESWCRGYTCQRHSLWRRAVGRSPARLTACVQRWYNWFFHSATW